MKKKVVSEVLRVMVCVCAHAHACVRVRVGVWVRVRVCSKMMFLTLPGKGITPQIFMLKFPVRTSGPKQKRKLNKMRIIKLLN